MQVETMTTEKSNDSKLARLAYWLPMIAGIAVCLLGQQGSAQEPKERSTLKGHTANVSSLAFSADGRRLVSGSYDATMKLWDVATGKELATFKDRPVRAVAITADSKTLATGSSDGLITLWDVATGNQKSTFKADTEAIRSLAFSTDGKTLVSGADNGMVKVWDVATSKERATLKRHSWRVTTVRFSADDKVLASASSHAVTLADMGMLIERYALNANDKRNTLVSIAFTSDLLFLGRANGQAA
jgi:WD40 repeat protein